MVSWPNLCVFIPEALALSGVPRFFPESAILAPFHQSAFNPRGRVKNSGGSAGAKTILYGYPVILGPENHELT